MKTIKILGLLLALVVGTLTVNAQTKTYNRYGISFTYPSTLSVDKETYEDGDFVLELTSEDDDSGIFIISTDKEEVVSMIQMMGIEGVFDVFKESMLEELDGVKPGSLKKIDSNTYSQPFTYTNDGVTGYADMIMSLKGDKFVMVLLAALSQEELRNFQNVYKSIKI